MAPSVLPHNSISIDSSYGHFLQIIHQCLPSKHSDTPRILAEMERLWTTPDNPNHVLPCLSVRTGLDLFLQAKAYLPGSEVIMTAINIKDMSVVIRHHGLCVVPVDIRIETLGPNTNVLEQLVTSRTVAILVAHVYGCRVDMDPIAALAEKYGLDLIEDCAECFCGFSRLSHVKSDVALFSFGVIKFSTSFGGAIVKVRNQRVFDRMKVIHRQYSVQNNSDYLKKVLKYFVMFVLLYCWPIPHVSQKLYQVGYDPKEIFIRYIRGFPNTLIPNIRCQPSPALLSAMLLTHTAFDQDAFHVTRTKGEYFASRLTPHMEQVGTGVEVNNYWLFPVLVKNPKEVIRRLNMEGMAAYRGSTQLALVEADNNTTTINNINNNNSSSTRSSGGSVVCETTKKSHHPPVEALYLMEHVIYLPVHRRVPFSDLDKMAAICTKVMDRLVSESEEGRQQGQQGVSSSPPQRLFFVPLKAKL